MTLNNTIIIPSLSGSSILSCLERGGGAGGELFCLGLRKGTDYDFFLAKPIFKIGFLNLFSSESMFPCREIWNFEACVPFRIEKCSKYFVKICRCRPSNLRKQQIRCGRSYRNRYFKRKTWMGFFIVIQTIIKKVIFQ